LAILGVRSDESSKRQGREVFGIRAKNYKESKFYSLEHALEVHQEALQKEKEPGGESWDCTLIKTMREKNDTVVSPIYEWSDSDVWDYLNGGGYSHNPMYDMGYRRVGCVGCPLATYRQKMKGFADFPTFKKHYIDAFQEMLEIQKQKGKVYDESTGNWKDGESVFNWWIEKDRYETRGQVTINDYLKDQTDDFGLIIRKPGGENK
jgi:phosphoadenosine phosphosulfate reductase